MPLIDPHSFLPQSCGHGLCVTGSVDPVCAPDPRWPGSWHVWRVGEPLPKATFDVIFLSEDVFTTLLNPQALLVQLREVTSSTSILFADFVPALDWELLAQALEGDIAGGEGVDQARATLSASALYRLFLDTGWVPSLLSESSTPLVSSPAIETAMQAAERLGVPKATALRNWQSSRLLLRCDRLFDEDLEVAECPASSARFSVVVPTTRPRQLRLNVGASPGLHELQAQLITVHDAKSAADAWKRAIVHIEEEWVLFCHQDVYFPKGFGRRLQRHLASIEPDRKPSTLLGFAGMGVTTDRSKIAPAGFVIDRRHRFDHHSTEYATSIDELAIVMHRDTVHRIDASLGWHLWATDLCVTAISRLKCFGEIMRIPLFHNSTNDYVLPSAFHESAARLGAKHADFGRIDTLCGPVNPLPAHRATI